MGNHLTTRETNERDTRKRKFHLETRKTRALADLRQIVWNATQYLTLDEVAQYVADVLNEIKSDQP